MNLRPVWSPAAEALAAIAERFGDKVWELVFEELQNLSQGSTLQVDPGWMVDEDEGELDTINEDERTWRDPSAHKFRSQVTLWLRENAARKRLIRVRPFPMLSKPLTHILCYLVSDSSRAFRPQELRSPASRDSRRMFVVG